ncbi:BatA and WFA domain-containing protein [soil metagenome]
MQFHNPEVLYALFLLVIPILIHLFQLRRFRKEGFTNVKFLRRITLQTRKSSRLKKYLVLGTRLLLLTCIILAFARPFFPSAASETGTVESIIYLDNSYSMQAIGPRGNLLERSIQELLEELPEDNSFTLITNDEVYRDVTRQDIQNIEFSAVSKDLNTVYLQAGNNFKHDENKQQKLLVISDFSGANIPADLNNINQKEFEVYALALKPQAINNISIDTIFYEVETVETGMLRVGLSFTGNNPENVPVSLYDGSNLLGKTSVDFTTQGPFEVSFPLTIDTIEGGSVQIEDNGLQFDNSFYFSLNRKQPVNIASINAAAPGFLERIYSGAEFNFSSMPEDRIDYNILSTTQVIILNEVQDLSSSLSTTLLSKAREDAVFIIIPSPVSIGSGLAQFIRSLGFQGLSDIGEAERLITGISFQHPLYEKVFEEQVSNFEYPRVQRSYSLNSSLRGILNFGDDRPFLTDANGHYLFTAPLNNDNSNFTQSPLVVPTFYNMGISALKVPDLYYTLGRTNTFDVAVTVSGDKILEISSSDQNFIPRQQNFTNKVQITTEDLPRQPGNFKIQNGDNIITAISYNIDRTESKHFYEDLTHRENIRPVRNLDQFFTSAGYKKEVDTLWKWFVTFALIFLILETLLLKYFK